MKPERQKTKAAKTAPASGSEKKTGLHPGGLHPLVALREDVDHLFDHFFSSFSLGPFGRHVREAEPLHRLEEAFQGFRPLMGKMYTHADVRETDGKIKIDVELPGMMEEDIDITISDDMLTVSGEKREEETTEDEDYRVCERRYGSVMRTFVLPQAANTEKVSASFKDGVLSIEMEKNKSADPVVKKVAIKN